MSNRKRVILHGEEVDSCIDAMVKRMSDKYQKTDSLVIVGIQKGGVELAKRIKAKIIKLIPLEPEFGTLDINLYRDDWTRIGTKPLVRATNLPFSIDDKKIILVDDVIFTGRTVRAALDALTDFGRPKSIELAVLVDRGHRELPICAQYVGLNVTTKPDEHVNVYWKNKNDEDIVELSSPSRTDQH